MRIVYDIWRPIDLANAIGEKPSTVRGWKRRDSIPARCWQAIVEATPRKYGLNAAKLAAYRADK